MASVYYAGNALDTTTMDLLSNDIINKIVAQEIEAKVFEDIFGIFTKKLISEGMQIEEIETQNLTSSAFDPTGANALAKASMDFKVLYHKINRRKTFKTTVSNAQIKMSMLNADNMAKVANLITTELWNSSAIEDYEAMKQLLVDICAEEKSMVICDLNGNFADMDAFTKAIQTLSDRFLLPSNKHNYSGYKKEFNKSKDELVLIIDAPTKARLNVDSLAMAFNMDKKELLGNIIVIDEMPTITYSSLTTSQVDSIGIGETNPILLHKYLATGTDSVSGSAVAFLVSKRAILRDPVEREVLDQPNAAGRFRNYYLHVTDVLSYSTLRNAVVFVD